MDLDSYFRQEERTYSESLGRMLREIELAAAKATGNYFIRNEQTSQRKRCKLRIKLGWSRQIYRMTLGPIVRRSIPKIICAE